MDNAEEERFVFYRLCHADFSEALRLLEDADLTEKIESLPNRVSGSLYRYAVVAYIRPFTSAKTNFFHQQRKGKDEKKIRLRKGIVPPELLSFHEELQSYRDSAYAHSDIAVRNPRLAYWPGGLSDFPIGFTPVDKKPLHIHKDKIRRLCEAGLAYVKTELSVMENRFRLLYPPSTSP